MFKRLELFVDKTTKLLIMALLGMMLGMIFLLPVCVHLMSKYNFQMKNI